jgi:transposase-like protein
VSHANARLTVHGRAELVRRVVDQGRPVAHVVAELNISRATGYKWLARWRAEGLAGLRDRSSRAHRLPGKTPQALEAQVLALRSARKLGPARIGPLIGLAPSTVHAVLRRHGLHRLAWLDRPTGQLIRRYERAHPGELVHVDVKKLGVIRPGGGLARLRPRLGRAQPQPHRGQRWPARGLRLRALRHR